MNNKINYSSISRKTIVTSSLLIFSLLIVTAFTVGLPSQSHAASYGYVNTSGNVVEVFAGSVEGAFANSVNIAEHSGVILIDGQTSREMAGNQNPTYNHSSGYMYVNDTGEVTHVNANTSSGAFTGSINISDRSGVMLINSISDSNMVGSHVAGY